MIVNFRDDKGNVLSMRARSFEEAYWKADAMGFYVYDYDVEEEDV